MLQGLAMPGVRYGEQRIGPAVETLGYQRKSKHEGKYRVFTTENNAARSLGSFIL